MNVRTATKNDERAIDELLAAAALPLLDKARFDPVDFLVAHEDGVIIGTVGIERYDNCGLLRSLVIAPDARSRGLGKLLVNTIEEHARNTGLDSLVLLTTTADPFFEQMGYHAIARGDMPIGVQASSEFSSVCPASALCMRKVMPKVQIS